MNPKGVLIGEKPRLVDEWRGWPIAVQAPKDIAPPTRHFVDTSIACRSLGVNPLDLMNDLESFGLFFEDFAVRE